VSKKGYAKPVQLTKDEVNGDYYDAETGVGVFIATPRAVAREHRGVKWVLYPKDYFFNITIGDLVEIHPNEFAPVIGGQPPMYDKHGTVWVEGETEALRPQDLGLKWFKPDERPSYREREQEKYPNFRWAVMFHSKFDGPTHRAAILAWQNKLHACLPNHKLTFKVGSMKSNLDAIDETGKCVGWYSRIGCSGTYPDTPKGESVDGSCKTIDLRKQQVLTLKRNERRRR
jgi:hypothetical protein